MKDKKVLVLGDPTRETDAMCSLLSGRYSGKYMGLFTKVPKQNGFYHFSLADVTVLEAEELIKHYDHLFFLKTKKENFRDKEVFHATRNFLLYVKNWKPIPYDVFDFAKH